jgi:hypothetical protein
MSVGDQAANRKSYRLGIVKTFGSLGGTRPRLAGWFAEIGWSAAPPPKIAATRLALCVRF